MLIKHRGALNVVNQPIFPFFTVAIWYIVLDHPTSCTAALMHQV